MTAERTTNQHELKLIRKLLHTDQQTKIIYRRLIDRVAHIMAKYPQRPSGVVIRVPDLDKELNAAIDAFRKELTTVIESGQAWAWTAANEKTDEILSEYIEGMPVSNVVRDGIFQRNTDAFNAFAARKTAGLQLSERIWRMTTEAKQMMSDYIDQALISGRSAQSLSQDVRELLIEPDKLFRRVRNAKTGKLELSRAAREYHPGRGVYRSSYKNAMRLARTEINMAYRMADQERWKRTDFVLGYEVKVSKQHWIKMPSGDICDQVAGPYPKEFVFKAWHPNCMCYTVPILPGKKDFLDNLVDGKPLDGKITDVPPQFKDYVARNGDRIAKYKQQPFWVQDNFKGGRIEKDIKLDRS